MKKKVLNLFLIPILLIASFSFILTDVNGQQSNTLPNGAVYESGENTYGSEVIKIWDEESFINNHTGSYSDIYTYSYDYERWEWNSTKGDYDKYLVRAECETKYESNYTSFTNTTMTGNSTLTTNLDVYRVNVTYGDNLYLIWMGLKNGTWNFKYFIDDMDYNYHYYNQYYRMSNCTYTKYDLDTGEQIGDPWDSSQESSGEYNYSSEDYDSFMPEFKLKMDMAIDFSMPLILTMQMYRTPNNQSVAWADMFCEYILFNDTDGDSVYSAGQQEVSGQPSFSLYFSDEYRGQMLPMAADAKMLFEIDYINNTIDIPGGSYTINDTKMVYSYKFPDDKDIEDFTSQIQFNGPNAGIGNNLSWDINYPNYPIQGYVMNPSSLLTGGYSTNPNSTYANLASGNFSYEFLYEIKENTTDLDYTFNLPRINNESFYNATQGLGLSIPHYSYFMASQDVDSAAESALTVPSDLFGFEINGTKIAEIDMLDPAKKNYTLYDYPTSGINNQYESKGATVSSLITSAAEQNSNPSSMIGGNPFKDLIFTLENYAKEYESLENFVSLYSIETQNYPVWSGRKLTHDPTFKAFYMSVELEGGFAIGGYSFVPLVAMSLVSSFFIIKKIRKLKE